MISFPREFKLELQKGEEAYESGLINDDELSVIVYLFERYSKSYLSALEKNKQEEEKPPELPPHKQ